MATHFSFDSPPSMPEQPTLMERARKLLPGVISGAADLDPAAVLTATVAGAGFGYSLGWVVLLCIPVLHTVFAVSSRIGQETSRGLIDLVREQYGHHKAIVLAALILVVNLAMIIGDIVAVADSCSLVTGQPRVYFLAAIAFIIWYLLIVGNYQKTTKALGLISLILISYVVAAWHVSGSLLSVASGVLIPRIQSSQAYTMAVVAVFGSLLTPDVIVWQASSRRGLPEGVAQAHVSESHAGTFVACVISLSAMIAASHLSVSDPSGMTTRTAAEALAPFGQLGPFVFSLGIIGSGLIALPILVASLCFAVSEAFGWESGLSMPPWRARFFFVMISVTVFVAVTVDFFGINTIKVLYWSQVLAGIVLVPIFLCILFISNDRRLMRTTNSYLQNFWLGCAAGGMLMSNLLFLWSHVFG
ncbi:MAG TPA: divalent metal cation transporter [Candidatus Angelobacter sp.]|jgi:Mn2+/Fe2+ NRAMP family transporter|nr:divalent metal cation transporter [Candidatus Angelobacter sp.]